MAEEFYDMGWDRDWCPAHECWYLESGLGCPECADGLPTTIVEEFGDFVTEEVFGGKG